MYPRSAPAEHADDSRENGQCGIDVPNAPADPAPFSRLILYIPLSGAMRAIHTHRVFWFHLSFLLSPRSGGGF